ncbi:chondroitinase [Algibacter lectus]|uniref:Chondroitinase n=1 Tax=Algibacter lectus TaxID=221126 RepID=A0A090WYQ4_9FLAO|nr:chondroitinase family protein [Algibacter lectus]GAL82101.1 chondroitinase [Algibacter lectus]
MAITTSLAFAQEKVMESFEDGIPKGLTTKGGHLSIDNLRIKHGRKALKWDWVGNSALVFNTPIGYHKARNLSEVKPEGRDKYLMDGHSSYDNKVVLEEPRGFFMWIYNEEAAIGKLTFQFGRDDIVDCEFDYNLNFVGWRSVAVIYDRGDMRGIPRADMNRMTILAPATSSGTYYIDAIGTSVPMNPKVATANPQLPYIKPHTRLVTNYEHRMYEFSKFRPSFPLEEMTIEKEKELDVMFDKVEAFIVPEYEQEQFKNKSIDKVVALYNSFEIKRNGDKIYGRPLLKANVYPEHFKEAGLGKKINEGCMEWREHFGKALINIASIIALPKTMKIKQSLKICLLTCLIMGGLIKVLM